MAKVSTRLLRQEAKMIYSNDYKAVFSKKDKRWRVTENKPNARKYLDTGKIKKFKAPKNLYGFDAGLFECERVLDEFIEEVESVIKAFEHGDNKVAEYFDSQEYKEQIIEKIKALKGKA